MNNFKLCILFMFFFICAPKITSAQEMPRVDLTKTISMDFQDANLKDVFKIFSIQSGLNFIASEAVQNRTITLFLDKVAVKDAMDKIFKANNLTYEMDKETNIFFVKDWGKPEIETITRVYYLKNRSVPRSRLEKERSNILSPVGTAAGAAAGDEGSGDLLSILRQVLSKEGKVMDDIATNSLIVTDVPSRFPDIERVIASLDIVQPQIILDVEVLDVSKDAIDKVGIDWPETFVKFDVTGARVTSFPFGSLGYQHAGEFLAPVKTAGGWENVSWPGKQFGPTIMTLFGTELLLKFLETQKDTRYLARPRLLTMNNETAEISITKDEVVGQIVTVENTSAGSTSKTEYIRSTDLKLTSEGTGIYLRVTPLINLENREIIMVINPKSSVTAPSAIDPTQSDAELRTTKSLVKIKDGETVILGGLIHKEKKVTEKKIKFLGDIPVFGALFRSKDQSMDVERELLIFITPRIIKEGRGGFARTEQPVIEDKTKGESERGAVINEYLDKFDKEKIKENLR